MGLFSNSVTVYLGVHPVLLNLFAFAAAFTTYFGMYAYRKPFTAASFPGLTVGTVSYKILLVIVQVVGYVLSKFAGIKVISEVNRLYRGLQVVAWLLLAELLLVGFGATPFPWNAVFMFLNGLSLGMIWGLVFSFLEGRRSSEVLGTGMSISFIVSSGIVKAIGIVFLRLGVSEMWMPAMVGAVFLPIVVIASYLLELIPDPNAEDIRTRTERVTMDGRERVAFFKEFWPGIVVMVVFYMFVTAFRDFRDNFAAELWTAFGYGTPPTVFAVTEIIVGVAVLIPICLFMLITHPLPHFVAFHLLIIGAMVSVAGTAFLYSIGALSGLVFMVLSGIFVFIAFVPFGCVIYDLLIATFRYKANSGFLIYLSDSFGYCASVAVMLVKNFAMTDTAWDKAFVMISYAVAASGVICMTIALGYYVWKYKRMAGGAPMEPSELTDSTEQMTLKERADISLFDPACQIFR
jgi:hypothetical protein